MVIDKSTTCFEYKQILKKLKAHDRTIVAVHVFRDPSTHQLTLATLAHDSLKLWSITAFDDEFELFLITTVQGWNCSVQSYTFSTDGKGISLISTDCSLYHISLDHIGVEKPAVEVVQKGLMEIWFIESTRSKSTPYEHFITVNYQDSQLQILDRTGSILNSVSFVREKARHLTAMTYSEKYIAIGTSQGVISIVNFTNMVFLYSTEAHGKKVRCLVLATGTDEDQGQKLLSASDDKTIKLFNLSETKAELKRIYCGHKGFITAISVFQSSNGSRFISSAVDNCLIIWEMDSGVKLHVFNDFTGTINDLPRCLCFTPNDRYMIVGTDEATILAIQLPISQNYSGEEYSSKYENEQQIENSEGDGTEHEQIMELSMNEMYAIKDLEHEDNLTAYGTTNITDYNSDAIEDNEEFVSEQQQLMIDNEERQNGHNTDNEQEFDSNEQTD